MESWIWHHWWPEVWNARLASGLCCGKSADSRSACQVAISKLKLQRRKHVSGGGAGWVTILICEIAGYLGKSPAREWEVHRQRMFGEIRLYCALCRVGPPRRVWTRVCENFSGRPSSTVILQWSVGGEQYAGDFCCCCFVFLGCDFEKPLC